MIKQILRQILLITLFVFIPFISARATVALDPLLNKVSLQLQAEQWVTTQTALVTVTINAAVSDTSLTNLQNQVIDQLKTLAGGDWHIVNMDRTQDSSGLESVSITTSARLSQIDLNGLRDRAKTMSKPGLTYTISSVAFMPSEDETRLANSNLRNLIYQQVKAEIDTLNKNYPDQKFYVHSIDFNDEGVMPVPQNYMRAMAQSASVNHETAPSPKQSLEVGNKARLNARVVIAAMPAPVAQALGAK